MSLQRGELVIDLMWICQKIHNRSQYLDKSKKPTLQRAFLFQSIQRARL